ncbi:NPOD, class II peroxidase [Cyathus striatus]|nr:NPOD, class II peroxidase [Cyathus striatus]
MPRSRSAFLRYFILVSGIRFYGSTLAVNSCPSANVVANIQANLFDTPCNEPVRAILHLAFHDAMGISRTSQVLGGGADGSIITFNSTESLLPGNEDMDFVVAWLKPLIPSSGLSDGDFLYLAAAVGVATCPGAPRLQFFAGRPKAVAPVSPNSGVPKPTDTVTSILARFADVGFAPNEVVSLLAAHSIAANYLTDKPVAGAPLDSTPALFDTQFFIETLLQGTLFPGNGSNIGEVMSPMRGEVRLQSDLNLAHDARTACPWQAMAGNQVLMQTGFKSAFAKLSMLGQNEAELIDCSSIIPVPAALPPTIRPHFPAGFSNEDVQQACATQAFPSLTADPGPVTSVPMAYVFS